MANGHAARAETDLGVVISQTVIPCSFSKSRQFDTLQREKKKRNFENVVTDLWNHLSKQSPKVRGIYDIFH